MVEISRLFLSAAELREMTDWPEALIEDYLNILDDIIRIVEEIDVIDVSTVTNTRLITPADSPYQATSDDDIIWCDCTTGPIIVTLRPSATVKNERKGKPYQIQKIDNSVNKVTISPTGGELINDDPSFDLIAQYEYIKPSATGTGWLF